MTAQRDADRALRVWFTEPTAPLPDRVLDSVLNGLPTVHQRRGWLPFWILAEGRSRARLAILVLTFVALLGGLLLVAGGRLALSPRPLPGGEDIPLDGGRYVQQAMPVRFGLTVPAGWHVAELTGDLLDLRRDEPDGRTRLIATFVDGLFLDPCRPEIGINDTFGTSSAELTTALASLPRIRVSPVVPIVIDGRAGMSVTITAPGSFAGCSSYEPMFPIALSPNILGMDEGASDTYRAIELEGRRLVILTTPGSSAGQADLDVILASIDFDALAVPEPTETGPRATPELWPTLPPDGQIPPGEYAYEIPLFEIDTQGRSSRVPAIYDAAHVVPAGWYTADSGFSSDPGASPAATFRVWSVSTVYRDPCHWQTGPESDRRTMTNAIGVATALSAWWPPTPDPSVTPTGYEAPISAPNVARGPVGIVWLNAAREVVLDIPADLSACDAGYALWSDFEGRVRMAQPGEHITLKIGNVGPAVVVAAAAYLPSATTADRQEVEAILGSIFVGLRPT